MKEQHDVILPKHYWPNIQVLTTWKCGNTKVYMEKFKDSFPATMLHQEFGYFASECRAGLVMNGGDDTVLFPHMHYFEFIRAEDLDNPKPEFLQLEQLEVGKRYCIYVTTFAGLYRYNMNDLVEVTGRYGTIPTIQFIQKVNGIIYKAEQEMGTSTASKPLPDSPGTGEGGGTDTPTDPDAGGEGDDGEGGSPL